MFQNVCLDENLVVIDNFGLPALLGFECLPGRLVHSFRCRRKTKMVPGTLREWNDQQVGHTPSSSPSVPLLCLQHDPLEM